MRIDLVTDDENRRLWVLNGELDLDRYEDMTPEEKEKWRVKLQERRYTVTLIKHEDETVH